MKRSHLIWCVIGTSVVFAPLAMGAASPLPSPLPSGYPVIVVNQVASISSVDFLTQVFNWVRELGGMSFCLKLSGAITLIIASMKVSFAQPLWDKFGKFKVLVTPILSLIIGVISLTINKELTAAAVGAYLFSGGGAIILHEILDAAKSLPGIGQVYLTLINVASNILGAPSTAPAAQNAVDVKSS